MDYSNKAIKCVKENKEIGRDKKASPIMTCLLIFSLLCLTACSPGGSKTLLQELKSTEAAGEVLSASAPLNTSVTELGTTEPADEEIMKDIDTNEYILPESDRRLYTREELSRLSTADLRLARNEIYARRGRIFITNDLQVYFASKSWYNPQYTASEFEQKGDAIFNEFELANCKLIMLMEQDSDRVDSNSAYILLNAGYTDIVNEYRPKRRLYASTEGMHNMDMAHIYSRIIDHGSYYEVTHGCIEADTSYDLSVMKGKTVGDTLQLERSLYRITEIEAGPLGEWEVVYLAYVSGPEDELIRFGRRDGEKYYTPLFCDGTIVIDRLYTGSLYFSKDCIITVNDLHNNRSHIVTIEDFFTQDDEVVGAEFGFHSNLDCITLWGEFEIGSSGVIISYTESFLP